MTQRHRTERRTRRTHRIGMAWWISGLAVLVACGGSGGTPGTTPVATARAAPSPTRSATPPRTGADTIPCLPADIVLHLHELLGEPNAAVHRRTCGR